jgi:creatinine amidohydrolase/Fe(II)-dependent formamide hydrolase-like protein
MAMKGILVLGALLLTPMMATAQANAGAGGQQDPAMQNMGGGNCSANVWNCAGTPNPLPPTNTVWIEEMTWMDVRDALAAGKTTAIIAAGGVEPNGPFLATGKHNFVLQANCEAIARRLGNALCAPLVKFVPEGNIENKSGHMASPGTISMRQETYEALLTDIGESLAMHGFENIIYIGDSGGNGAGATRVAAALNEKFTGPKPIFAYVPEHYEYGAVGSYMREQHGLEAPQAAAHRAAEAAERARLEGRFGAGHMCVNVGLQAWRQANPQTWNDNLHDDPVITLNMYAADPFSVRWEERVQAGLATINGVSIADPVKSMVLAAEIVDFRADHTIGGIERAIANGGTVQSQGGGGGGGGGRGGGAGDQPAPNCG